MRGKIKFLAVMVFMSLLIMPFFAKDAALCRSNSNDRPEAPRLAYPRSEEVSVTGDSLEFKWWHAAIGIDHYDFMLYKGGGSSGDAILQKTLPFNVSSIKVEANLLENGQVYTWTLRQVGDNGQKSEKSFLTFRVSK